MHKGPALRVENTFEIDSMASFAAAIFQLPSAEKPRAHQCTLMRFDGRAYKQPATRDVNCGVKLGEPFFEPSRQAHVAVIEKRMYIFMRGDARHPGARVKHDVLTIKAANIKALCRCAVGVAVELI